MIGNHDVIYFAIKFCANDPNFSFEIWALIWLHRGHISKEVVFNNKIVSKTWLFSILPCFCVLICALQFFIVCVNFHYMKNLFCLIWKVHKKCQKSGINSTQSIFEVHRESMFDNSLDKKFLFSRVFRYTYCGIFFVLAATILEQHSWNFVLVSIYCIYLHVIAKTVCSVTFRTLSPSAPVRCAQWLPLSIYLLKLPPRFQIMSPWPINT